MKKILTFILCGMLCLSFTACGADPVAKELKKFANEDMAQVNDEYNKLLKDYSSKTDSFKTANEYYQYLTTDVIVKLKDIDDKVKKIDTKETEVTDLKNKYEAAIEAYITAFGHCADAAKSEDSQSLAVSQQEVVDNAKLINEYNNSLKSLAKKYDMKVIGVE